MLGNSFIHKIAVCAATLSRCWRRALLTVPLLLALAGLVLAELSAERVQQLYAYRRCVFTATGSNCCCNCVAIAMKSIACRT